MTITLTNTVKIETCSDVYDFLMDLPLAGLVIWQRPVATLLFLYPVVYTKDPVFAFSKAPHPCIIFNTRHSNHFPIISTIFSLA